MRTQFQPTFSIALLRRCALLAGFLYLLVFLALGFLESPYDYDLMASQYEMAWRWWRHDAGLPHFNPLYCGGRPLASDPQIPIYNPWTFLVPLLGAVWTVKWEMLFQLALGIVGILGILGRWNLGAHAYWWAVFLYLSGGAVVTRFMTGHLTLGYYFTLPLLLLFSYQSSDGKRTAGWLAGYWVLVAYCFLHKPNFLIQVVPVLLIEVLVRSLVARDIRPMFHSMVSWGIGGLVNAATLFPSYLYFQEYPRVADGIPNSTPVHTWLLSLLFPIKTLAESWYGPNFMGRHEYSIFLGLIPVAFGVLGFRRFWRTYRAEAAGLFALFFVSTWLGLGVDNESFGWAPYSWLHPFWPGFSSIRVPPRFWYGCFITLILSSCFWCKRRIGGWDSFWVAITILPLLLNATVNLSKTLTRTSQWKSPSSYHREFSWVNADEGKHYLKIRQGYGIINCHFNMNIPQAELKEGLALPPESSMAWETWNRISLNYRGDSKQVALQLNHAPYWRFVGQGARIRSKDREPLTLSLEPTATGLLVYELPGVAAGLWISVATILSSLLALGSKFVYDRRYGS